MRAIVFALAILSAPPAVAAEPWTTLPPTPALPTAIQSGLAPVDGVKIWYAEFGRGAPVLLLHSGLGNSNYWGDQVRALVAAHYRAIVMDSRGQGRSTRDAEAYSYDLMAKDVVGLLDYLKIKKVALVGLSDGAIVGLDVTMHYPKRVTKLFAFGANYEASGVNNTPSAEGDLYFARVQKEYRALSPTPGDFKKLLAQMGPMWSTEPHWTQSDLEKIETPTWIADGDHDDEIKPDQPRNLAERLPHATLVIERGVGHFAVLQNPVQFTADLLRFLKSG